MQAKITDKKYVPHRTFISFMIAFPAIYLVICIGLIIHILIFDDFDF